MKTKTFDCVEMKRKGAARIYEERKDMTMEELIEYWRKQSADFLKHVEDVRRRLAGDHSS